MPYIGVSPQFGVRRKHTYTATAGQTSFSGAGSEGVTLSYKDSNFVDVYQNGVKLGDADYTSTSGTAIVLAQGASVSDLVEIIVFDAFSAADTVSKADGGTFDGNVTVSGTLGVTGALSAKGGAVFNEDSADVDFRVESNGNANMLVVDGGNDSVGISNSAPPSLLTLGDGTSNITDFDLSATNTGQDAIFINSSDETSASGAKGNSIGFGAVDGHTNRHASICTVQTGSDRDQVGLAFHVHEDASQTADLIEAARIDNNGNVYFNVTANVVSQSGTTTTGQFFGKNSYVAFSRIGVCLYLNRQYSDGDVLMIRQDGTDYGNIYVNSSTGNVSYNAFSGSHWSRLSDNSKPSILAGTIIETVDEMCDWYQAKITIPKTNDNDERIIKDSIALPKGKKVGDTISHTYEGVTYDDAVIIKENDKKHTKCKISDTADSKRVYGVFANWDNDDDIVNDMYVTAVGTYIVRINGDVTVEAGDLLSSNGDGTAKVQDDDIIRSKTIGKVLTNIKQETYDDGSYTVPCALYCG